MKNLIYLFLAVTTLFTVSCSNDDDAIDMEEEMGRTKVYNLGAVSDNAISGTATFTENEDLTTTVDLELTGTSAGNTHPAHIHFNTAAEGGDIAVSLEAVSGDTGTSTTVISSLDDGTPITYEEFLDFDGYINVHFSVDELGTLIAQGDIGANELTGVSKSYALGSVASPDISGEATFFERVSGATLVELQLEGTPDGGMHPAHIHFNTAAEGGDIAISLGAVNGTTGFKASHVEALDDETAISYTELLSFDGYINVHLSAEELGTIVAQGDIGQNELTGESLSYVLEERNASGVSGQAIFSERVNGETLVTLDLDGVQAGAVHPSHIHEGSIATAPGAIIVDLLTVTDTGLKQINVTALVDGTPLNYEAMTQIDGYINVHLSADDLSIVAQGNVGANAAGDGAKSFEVTNDGTTAYVFNASDLTDASNPGLTLTRGATYTFSVDASGHPFFIKSVQGNTEANAYSNGVTNNGAQSGTVTFVVPMDAPDTLFYNCQFHSSMTGVLTIVD
ncbi:hypothetical protein [Croceiramulus getboli]|nr:hypothetical protein P8624_13110 [Flavobacteriaceae bacterium YJPT1-3]